jgi:hypothetical protein
LIYYPENRNIILKKIKPANTFIQPLSSPSISFDDRNSRAMQWRFLRDARAGRGTVVSPRRGGGRALRRNAARFALPSVPGAQATVNKKLVAATI